MAKTKKRLVIDVSEEDHKEIKLRAFSLGMTISKWLSRAIVRQVKYEQDLDKTD